jgi:hypothetical protein
MFKILSLHKKYTVYRIPDSWENDIQPGEGLSYSKIDGKIIDRFFENHKNKDKLHSLYELNYIGYLLHNKEDWINYIWCSTPQTPPPTHIPGKIFDKSNYWIFFCRTNEAFRNQGFYTYGLKLFCQMLIEKYGVAKNRIYIDTELELIPADKAIRKAGFEECGYLSVSRIYFPRLLDIKFGEWHKDSGEIIK